MRCCFITFEMSRQINSCIAKFCVLRCNLRAKSFISKIFSAEFQKGKSILFSNKGFKWVINNEHKKCIIREILTQYLSKSEVKNKKFSILKDLNLNFNKLMEAGILVSKF